ncbi:C-GCAxxG-C-C family protein [Selenomonas ruminis]|uniref:C_GCAxxG_C_C family protein n=1 Tax=Selenomonas ruminis TaxID=2593411 RepID=A0A5D6W1X0_9FIRM|nr:C-GCAxxG-C-C family protein [Selenomonas sp. mPRGC5]TYZ21402.1 C_GCAxxG_C_C family protein [Selenomonas sp. mPRGC5]
MANVRAEKAVEYKKTCNCAQAVLLAFKDEMGKSEEELLALGSGFGSGMGGMEATCGALCGAAMAAGFLNASAAPTKMMTKAMLEEFKEKAGATICGDLKGIKTKKMLCSCDDCVRHAVVALENQL